MTTDSRIKRIGFATARLKEDLLALDSGQFEEKQLAAYIRQATEELLLNPRAGVKLPERLWPKEIKRRYDIDNLFKYDLPGGWRLIYTLRGTAIEVLIVLLEWYKHKDYEKRFGYNVG